MWPSSNAMQAMQAKIPGIRLAAEQMVSLVLE